MVLRRGRLDCMPVRDADKCDRTEMTERHDRRRFSLEAVGDFKLRISLGYRRMVLRPSTEE